MVDPSSEASRCLAYLKKCINALVESGGSGSEQTAEIYGAHEAFKIMFQQEKIGSLKAVLDHLSELTFEKVVVPKWRIFAHETKEIRRNLTDVVQRSMNYCLQKSLTHESNEELLKLTEFIEGHADKCKFEVDSLVSCLQIAVSVGGSLKLLELVNQRILPDFDKLTEQRKLDFMKAFSEISPHTTAHLADQMLPSVVGLLEKYMPADKSKFDEKKSSTHLECLLYTFHRLAHKGGDAEAIKEYCKSLKERLKSVKKITKARLGELVQTLADNNATCLEAEKYDKNDEGLMKCKFIFERRRHNTKTEMRTCINLVAMMKVLRSKIPSFMGDNSVKLSWKEAKKPVFGENIDETAKKVPDRPVQLDSLPKDLMKSLIETGNCYLNKDWVRHVMGSSRFQQVQQSKPEGPWLLNDNSGVAMLCWQINESEFSEFRVEDVVKKGSTGSVRDQMFHLLCWTYTSSDLARGKLEPHKLTKYSPFCTWYMCAFCHPEALGSVPNKPEEVLGIITKKKEVHHCYGGTIEKGLRHIQKYGIPREVCTVFNCTDHQPPSADEPHMSKRKITGIRKINTLKEALSELKNQPIGADLLHYTGLHLPGKHIYYGPYSKFYSSLVAYHAVIIESLEVIDGQLVAVCKMSNGEYVADGGYVYVSLSTVYMPVGVAADKKDSVRNTFEPTHLLTNFRVPTVDDGKIDKNDDTDSSEEEEEMEEDKKEEMEDSKELVEEKPEESAAKRLCTPASRRVKDSDGSIRKRALELVSLLGNENNVKQLTKALIDYLEVCGEDFKGIIENNEGFKEDHSARACSKSYMTTKALALVALLKLSSHFPIISKRIKDIIVEQKKSLLLEMQQRAIRSSLAERMPLLDEATFSVRSAGSLPASLSTMAKLSVSIPNGVAAAPLVDLLDLDSDDILAVPSSSSGADFLQDLLGVDLGSSSEKSVCTVSGATPAAQAGTDLLLDILSIGSPSLAQDSTSSIDLLSTTDVNNNSSTVLDTLSSPAQPQIATTASAGDMFDLFDGLSPSPSKEATNGPAYPPVVAYESSSLKIAFTFSKPSGNHPHTTNVEATFINLSPNTFTDFVFQAAVPKFLQLHLDPASSNTRLESGNITQNLRVTNSQHGKKSLVMRMRIGYELNRKDVLEEGQINNFPRGL